MYRRLKSLGAKISVLVLFASFVTLLSAAPAEARCAGSGNPATSNLVINGAAWATETPVSGTCNNNGTYQGTFRSNVAGWRASVYIQNNGNWVVWYGGYNTTVYSYEYSDGNSNSLIHLCIDNGSTWYCGWGNQVTAYYSHTYYGVNTGF